MSSTLMRCSAAALLVAGTAFTVGGCTGQVVENPVERQTVENSDSPDSAGDSFATAEPTSAKPVPTDSPTTFDPDSEGYVEGYGVDQLPGTENYVDHTFAQFVIRLPRDYERVDERSTAVTNTDEYAADGRPTILLVEALTADDSQLLEELSGGCVELSFRDVPADNPSLIINTYSVDGDVCGGQDFVVYQIFDMDENPLGAVVFLDRYAVDTTNEGIVRSVTRNE